MEKLRYIHRNPVKGGFCEHPEDWKWSSFRHYALREQGVVEIESDWLARDRERQAAGSAQGDILDPRLAPKERARTWATRLAYRVGAKYLELRGTTTGLMGCLPHSIAFCGGWPTERGWQMAYNSGTFGLSQCPGR